LNLFGAIGKKPLLVTKGHWTELPEATTAVVDRLNVSFITNRGWLHAQATVAAHHHIAATYDWRAKNTCDVGSLLPALGAEANGGGFIGGAGGADLDILAAGFDFASRTVANANVGSALGVVEEGELSDGGIEVARGAAHEYLLSDGGIASACGVGEKSAATAGGILAARGVAEESGESKRIVVSACRNVRKRVRPTCRVVRACCWATSCGCRTGAHERAKQNHAEAKSDCPGEPF
jgi:hypothetical protein